MVALPPPVALAVSTIGNCAAMLAPLIGAVIATAEAAAVVGLTVKRIGAVETECA